MEAGARLVAGLQGAAVVVAEVLVGDQVAMRGPAGAGGARRQDGHEWNGNMKIVIYYNKTDIKIVLLPMSSFNSSGLYWLPQVTQPKHSYNHGTRSYRRRHRQTGWW